MENLLFDFPPVHTTRVEPIRYAWQFWCHWTPRFTAFDLTIIWMLPKFSILDEPVTSNAEVEVKRYVNVLQPLRSL